MRPTFRDDLKWAAFVLSGVIVGWLLFGAGDVSLLIGTLIGAVLVTSFSTSFGCSAARRPTATNRAPSALSVKHRHAGRTGRARHDRAREVPVPADRAVAHKRVAPSQRRAPARRVMPRRPAPRPTRQLPRCLVACDRERRKCAAQPAAASAPTRLRVATEARGPA